MDTIYVDFINDNSRFALAMLAHIKLLQSTAIADTVVAHIGTLGLACLSKAKMPSPEDDETIADCRHLLSDLRDLLLAAGCLAEPEGDLGLLHRYGVSQLTLNDKCKSLIAIIVSGTGETVELTAPEIELGTDQDRLEAAVRFIEVMNVIARSAAAVATIGMTFMPKHDKLSANVGVLARHEVVEKLQVIPNVVTKLQGFVDTNPPENDQPARDVSLLLGIGVRYLLRKLGN